MVNINSLLSEAELGEMNKFREAEGLPPLVTKIRRCLQCAREFKSQGLRLCPSCQKTRNTPAAHADGCAYPDGVSRAKGDGRVYHGRRLDK